MTKTHITLSILLCTKALAADPTTTGVATHTPAKAQVASAAGRAGVPPTAPSAATVSAAYVVYYDPDTVPTIYTKIRYSTAIVFPDTERVMEVICGDKDWWQIAGPDRIVYVKPSRAGIATNLTVIGQSGLIYNFLLQEVTPLPDGPPPPTTTPYVKVSVIVAESAQHPASTATEAAAAPKYVQKSDMDAALQAADQRLRATTEELKEVKTATGRVIETEVNRLRTNYPAALSFDYQVALGTKPFFVRAMFCDDKFTYIKLDSQEAPAVYEIVDGRPALVNFDYVDGLFVIRKIVAQGYLAIGKAKLPFAQKGH